MRIEAVTDIDALRVMDEDPSPERATGARRELERVLGLIALLPPVCRRVIELRRIHGFSQKETARRLGVTEPVVENNSIRGLRVILRALEDDVGASRWMTHDDRTSHADQGRRRPDPLGAPQAWGPIRSPSASPPAIRRRTGS